MADIVTAAQGAVPIGHHDPLPRLELAGSGAQSKRPKPAQDEQDQGTTVEGKRIAEGGQLLQQLREQAARQGKKVPIKWLQPFSPPDVERRPSTRVGNGWAKLKGALKKANSPQAAVGPSVAAPAPAPATPADPKDGTKWRQSGTWSEASQHGGSHDSLDSLE
ncbi:hypothetical protein MMC18_009281 [Xylographa bjoerkii]|nr:hypothetical protein [Xylographa bjoerkii]